MWHITPDIAIITSTWKKVYNATLCVEHTLVVGWTYQQSNYVQPLCKGKWQLECNQITHLVVRRMDSNEMD